MIVVTIPALVVATALGARSFPATDVELLASRINYIGYDYLVDTLIRYTLPLDATSDPVVAPSTDLIAKYTTDATTVVSTVDLRPTKPIDGGQIQDGTVTGDAFADGSVTTPKLAAGAVTTAKLATGAVTSTILATDAVTNSKIADNAVSSAELATDAVTTSKILDGAVSSSKLATDAVTQTKILDGAVSTSKLADLGVTSAKLASGAVTTAKIAAGAVTWSELASAVYLLVNALPNPTYVEGTTETLLGSVHLLAGTASTVRAQMGCLATGDTATLKLYRSSDNTLITTLTVTGALAIATQSAVTIASAGAYELRGYCDNVSGTAVFRMLEVDIRP